MRKIIIHIVENEEKGLECQECKPIKYRQLYDEYRGKTNFGSLDEFLRPDAYEERCKAVDTGYRVNKETSDVIYGDSLHNVLAFKVFDHIRTIEETLTGIFSVDNFEFKMILRPFLKEYFMSHVYLVYSPEVKAIELNLIKAKAYSLGEDPYERIEKSYPDSNFRLLRRTLRNGEWEGDALLSHLTNVKFDENISNFHPIRFSFNEGYFFLRLYHIFMQYEVELQTYHRLFQVIHTAMIIKGKDRGTIDNKAREVLTGHVFIGQETTDLKTGTAANTTELVKDMPYLINSYDVIHAELNDNLARLGLGGEDSTKCERITTGENFRSLRPTMAYIQAMLSEFENITFRIKKNLFQGVKFTETIKSTPSGIPFGKTMKQDASPPNYSISNDQS